MFYTQTTQGMQATILVYSVLSYLATWVEIALNYSQHLTFPPAKSTYRPLGSVCFDHIGTHRSTVDAQYGGKCSSNIMRYQYLGPLAYSARNPSEG